MVPVQGMRRRLANGRIIKRGEYEKLTLYARADQGRYFGGKRVSLRANDQENRVHKTKRIYVKRLQ